jgi:hypothetical protein
MQGLEWHPLPRLADFLVVRLLLAASEVAPLLALRLLLAASGVAPLLALRLLLGASGVADFLVLLLLLLLLSWLLVALVASVSRLHLLQQRRAQCLVVSTWACMCLLYVGTWLTGMHIRVSCSCRWR